MTFLPREHGAYGQLAFPLLTAYVVAGVTVPALLVGASAIAAFLAHEPLLVVAGRRGPRARREAGAPALRWLVATGGIAVVAGVAALLLASPAARPWFLLPLAPALVVAIAVALDREKSAAGELGVALAFSSLAVAVCVAAGATPRMGLAVALAFAAVFVVATLSVRSVIVAVRGGGDPTRAVLLRAAAVSVAAVALGALGVAAARGVLPWAAFLAPLPGVLASVLVPWFSQPARRLRTVGWVLIAACFTASAILIVGVT
jgi:hypothetical protein